MDVDDLIDHDPDAFVSMGRLRRRGITVQALATEIEKNGIWSWDRYDRWVRCDPASEIAKRALDALADMVSGADDQPEPDPRYSPWIVCGWMAKELPNFKAIGTARAAGPIRQQGNKSDNATLRIVGGLLAFIRGDLKPSGPHPDYESDARLIDLLSDSLQGYEGLSKRNLEDKFAKARRLIDFK